MLGKKVIGISLVLTCLLFGYSVTADANQTRRDGKWEATFQFSNTQSFDVLGVNEAGDPINSNIDNDLGWGFTFGYNINEHVLVNFEWMASTPNYSVDFTNENGNQTSINNKLDLYHTQINGVYNFSTDQFTPFVQAGFGWSYVDSNIANGPPQGGCWYDPWWGYICNTYQSTFDDTRFSYNVAAGFRYEIDNGLTLKASYKQLWMNLSSSEDASMGIIHLEIGSIF